MLFREKKVIRFSNEFYAKFLVYFMMGCLLMGSFTARYFPEKILFLPVFQYSVTFFLNLFSIFLWILFIVLKPKLTRFSFFVALPVLCVLYYQSFFEMPFISSHVYTYSFLLWSIILFMLRNPGKNLDEKLHMMLLEFFTVIVITWVTFPFLIATSIISPVYDFHVIAFERMSGLVNIKYLVQVLSQPSLFMYAVNFCYNALPLWLIFILIMERKGERKTLFMKTYILSLIVGFWSYPIVPCIGPEHAIIGYPFFDETTFPLSQYWPVSPRPYERNSMPSLHTTWALLILYRLAWFGPFSKVFLLFVASFNIMATMLTYNHWITDLIVAVPFSVLMLCLSRQTEQKHSSLHIIIEAGCLILYVAWLAMIKYDPIIFENMPQLAYGLIAVTLIFPWWGVYKVQKNNAPQLCDH